MLEDDLDHRNTLGPRGADIVLAERVQHRSLGQTCDISRRICRQRYNRQDQRLTRRIPDRQPPQLDAEYQHKECREHEGRHRRKQRCEEDDDTVDRPVPEQGRH